MDSETPFNSQPYAFRPTNIPSFPQVGAHEGQHCGGDVRQMPRTASTLHVPKQEPDWSCEPCGDPSSFRAKSALPWSAMTTTA